MVRINAYRKVHPMNDAKYIGLDVHQATISAAVLDSTGKLVMESILETKAATILQFFQRFAEARTSKSRVESPNVRSSSFPNCKNVRSVLKPTLKLGDSCGEEIAQLVHSVQRTIGAKRSNCGPSGAESLSGCRSRPSGRRGKLVLERSCRTRLLGRWFNEH